jgi:cytosine/adenosine deaminase-related metal-dependent hydrolase
MLLRADTVLTMIDEPISPGCVRVTGSEIAQIGHDLQPAPGEEVIDLPGCVLTPGLINAHCHLDYTGMKGAIFPGKSFPEWIKTINSLKSAFGPEDYLRAIAEGFDLLADSGCTTVINIEAFPDLLVAMPTPPLRTWWFLELIDIRQRISDDSVMAGALRFFDEHPGWPGGFGLSPHAPYTASIDLYRLAKHCGDALGMPCTTHIAESVEEQEMFLYGRGPLHDFLADLGRDMSDCGQGSALSHLLEHGVLTSRTLAVHMNYLQEYDLAALRRHPLPVVHCPKCHDYFRHARFPLEKLKEVGCIISLGTDSLASNDTLDLRSEMRQARRHYPQISSYEWMTMVTLNPARALGLSHRLGAIRVGAWADLAAFPLPAGSDPYTAVIRSTGTVPFLMVHGRLVRPGTPS